jgi:hypothetical protein
MQSSLSSPRIRANELESLSKNPENRLLEAHLSVDGERFLTESLIYTYSEANSLKKPKDELNGENSAWLRKIVFQASRMSNFGKFLRWEMEKHRGISDSLIF